ncbi:MAG: hypothetical protein ACRD3M_02550 [Thermoanaerobaculia bacterium]
MADDTKIGAKINEVDVEYASGADNPVKQELIDLLKGVVKSGVATGNKLDKIWVSATTNGTHGTGSRHYSGKAIDISRINSKYMSASYSSDSSVKAIVDALQDEADKQLGIRENFGPKFLHKHKANWTVDAHDDHIHLSVD